MDYKPIIKLGILHFVNVTIKYGLEIVYKIYLSNDEERFTRNWIRKARKR